MNVGDEQRLFPWPKERAFGEQRDALAADHGRERADNVIVTRAGGCGATVER
jgi:hypothetical protein